MKNLSPVTLLLGLCVVGACGQAKAPFELSDQVLVQAERVFGSITAAQHEYQRLFSETRYPDDSEKKDAANWFAEKEAGFNIVRISYLDLKEKRTRESLTTFVSSAWQFVNSPEAVFTRYDFNDKTLKDGKEIYANLSQIESIVAEFRVFAVSVLKEVK
jgi:hypothetical protein